MYVGGWTGVLCGFYQKAPVEENFFVDYCCCRSMEMSDSEVSSDAATSSDRLGDLEDDLEMLKHECSPNDGCDEPLVQYSLQRIFVLNFWDSCHTFPPYVSSIGCIEQRIFFYREERHYNLSVSAKYSYKTNLMKFPRVAGHANRVMLVL